MVKTSIPHKTAIRSVVLIASIGLVSWFGSDYNIRGLKTIDKKSANENLQQKIEYVQKANQLLESESFQKYLTDRKEYMESLQGTPEKLKKMVDNVYGELNMDKFLTGETRLHSRTPPHNQMKIY